MIRIAFPLLFVVSLCCYAGPGDAPLPPFVGSTDTIRGMSEEKLIQMAESEASVMIIGETGTGKEVLARRIHELSKRKKGIFLPINLAALNPALIESELFGHKKGAYTGADSGRKGLLESANGGTVFLDELGDAPPEVQVRLLRCLEERMVQAVGESELKSPLDIRVISATNKNLREEVTAGRFREDLFFRLNTFELETVPLRERLEDLQPMINFFLELRVQRLKDPIVRLVTPAAMEALLRYRWPGNVRELIAVLDHAAILSTNYSISPEDLPGRVLGIERPSIIQFAAAETLTLEAQLDAACATAVEEEGGRTKAAARLGISTKTLAARLRRHEERLRRNP